MDRERFKEVYEEHYIKMLRYARTMVHDLDTAHDLVLDVFLLYHKNADIVKYDEVWLIRATRNLCIDHLRRVKLHRIMEDTIELEEWEPFKCKIIEAEVGYNLSKEISKFPPRCSRIVTLFLKGLNSKQIGERLGISSQTANNQYSIAVKKLRSQLH